MTLTEIYENYPYMKDDTLCELLEDLESMSRMMAFHAREIYPWTFKTRMREIEETQKEINALITVIKERSKENE